MNWRCRAILVLAVAMCLGSAGCGSVHRIHYYTLGDSGLTVPDAGDQTKPLLRVERLTVAEPYAGRRIVYRPNPSEIAFWEFRQWAEPPGRMITSRLANRMGASGLFRDVDSFPYEWKDADFVLKGVVLAFEEVDVGDDWHAHVKMFLELTGTRSGRRTLWSEKIDVEKKASSRDAKAVVTALSQALDEAIARAEEGIASAVRSDG
jgi:cholesterol transport system auxiliary component